ncbi:MAG: molybdate ABC transporter permease subunit, partial [Moraxellaceae bacterium]
AGNEAMSELLAHPELWQALWLTLRLSLVSALLLVLIGVPLAGWFSASRSRMSALLEMICGLPLVLPPTVLGFYLLILLAPGTWLGDGWTTVFGHPLPFSFAGLVLGSVLYSLPFVLTPIQTAFRAIDTGLIDASVALGARPRQTFWRIVVPVSMPGIIAGFALAFAHTLGEFGVVLMLGGNIPGETRVASIALYDEVQKLNYPLAHAYALVLLVVSALLLLLITLLQRRQGGVLRLG